MVRHVGQDEAAVLLLPREGFVVVAVVVLLIAQSEEVRQRLQLGGDVRLQEVVALPLLSLQAAVSAGLQELQEKTREGGCSATL